MLHALRQRSLCLRQLGFDGYFHLFERHPGNVDFAISSQGNRTVRPDQVFAALGTSRLYDERALFGMLMPENTPENEWSSPSEEDAEDGDASTLITTWFVLSAVACEATLIQSVRSAS